MELQNTKRQSSIACNLFDDDDDADNVALLDVSHTPVLVSMKKISGSNTSKKQLSFNKINNKKTRYNEVNNINCFISFDAQNLIKNSIFFDKFFWIIHN